MDNCKQKELENTFVMDEAEITLDEKFDIIIIIIWDCLEHIENDIKCVKNWAELLNDNWKIIIFVPAYKFLWSNHDDVYAF